ncbi:hypothetical protein Ahia01_000521100 [Argonauta hians]
MALLPSTRISLKFNDIIDYECWFLVDHQRIPSVSVLQQQINNRFYHNVKGKIILTLKGSLIPPWESSLILRDNDQIIVQKENGNIEQRYVGKKKKKKKLGTSLIEGKVTEKDSYADDVTFISENTCGSLDNSRTVHSIKHQRKPKKRKDNQDVVYLEEIQNDEEYSEVKDKKTKKKGYSEGKVKSQQVYIEKKPVKQKKEEDEDLEKNEHKVKKRKREIIEVYEPPILKKKKKKSKSNVRLVNLGVENSHEIVVEQVIEKQEKKHKEACKLSKHQSKDCDKYKEIVINVDEEEEEEKAEEKEDNHDISSYVKKDKNILIVDDDDDDDKSIKANLVVDSIGVRGNDNF